MDVLTRLFRFGNREHVRELVVYGKHDAQVIATAVSAIGNFAQRRPLVVTGHNDAARDELVHCQDVVVNVKHSSNLSDENIKRGPFSIRKRDSTAKSFELPRVGSGARLNPKVSCEKLTAEVGHWNPRVPGETSRTTCSRAI